jgi:hypothetical protein
VSWRFGELQLYYKSPFALAYFGEDIDGGVIFNQRGALPGYGPCLVYLEDGSQQAIVNGEYQRCPL